jgi:hypothetical protein
MEEKNNSKNLVFVKQKKSQGIYEETGYYFKNEFLDRYKTKAIEILRARIKEAGNGDFVAGKEKAPEEWAVIHEEYLKSVEATKKTNHTKKPYWDMLRKRTLQNRIHKLRDKIEWIEERRQQAVLEFDERIKVVEKEIQNIEKEISENEDSL